MRRPAGPLVDLTGAWVGSEDVHYWLCLGIRPGRVLGYHATDRVMVVEEVPRLVDQVRQSGEAVCVAIGRLVLARHGSHQDFAVIEHANVEA